MRCVGTVTTATARALLSSPLRVCRNCGRDESSPSSSQRGPPTPWTHTRRIPLYMCGCCSTCMSTVYNSYYSYNTEVYTILQIELNSDHYFEDLYLTNSPAAIYRFIQTHLIAWWLFNAEFATVHCTLNRLSQCSVQLGRWATLFTKQHTCQ